MKRMMKVTDIFKNIFDFGFFRSSKMTMIIEDVPEKRAREIRKQVKKAKK